jgi:ribose transport system permease protein
MIDSRWRGYAVEYGGMAGALLLILVFFGSTTDRFLTLTNFQTIANQVPAIVIVAVGMTYVLLVAGIDLSVGSALALCSAILAKVLINMDGSIVLAIPAAILTGTALGFLNGMVVARWAIPSFIVTLATLEVARGLTYVTTDSLTIYVGSQIDPLRALEIGGISFMFYGAILVAIAGQIVLTKTTFGRYVTVVGYNEEVAFQSGINPKRIKLIVFTLAGTLVGLASIAQTARLSASDPNAGIGFELDVIAAVVIGGTSLSGGRGSVVRSLFGVLVIALLGSGLAQAGAQEHTKRIITGGVILAAVILDRYRRRNSST